MFPATRAAGQAGLSLVDSLLEQLAGIGVTSVSRQGTGLAEGAALIYIISWTDIGRGPGATIWGANVVNGVINIITPQGTPGAANGPDGRIGGANLLRRAHAEFGAAATRQRFERAVLAKLVLRF